ncbi:RNA polymerase sigma factor [Streptomyces sp. NPDC054871]
MGELWGTPGSVGTQEVRDHLGAYGYGTLLRLIRSRQVYERCVGTKPPIRPTFDELETLRRSADERHVLASETVLAVLERQHKVWATWDARKGAALETYFVNALLLRFPTVFRAWQRTRRSLPLPYGADVAALSVEVTHLDPALAVVSRDALERALRTAGPEVRAVLGLVAVGYPHSDIADRLGISERAVEGRLYRFRRQVRSGPDGSSGNVGPHAHQATNLAGAPGRAASRSRKREPGAPARTVADGARGPTAPEDQLNH